MSVTLMPETLAQLTLGEHFGGTATCTKRAVCEACGEEYGELDTDEPQNTDGKSDEKVKVPESPKTGDTI